MATLHDLAKGRDNNFQLIRAVMALVVAAAHCINVFTNSADAGSLFGEGLFTVALIALDCFFVFSGFLVTASLARRNDPVEYVVARALRIVPALLLVSLCCAYVMGPLVTTESLGTYFSDTATHLYGPVTGLTTHPDLQLPGVFQDFADSGVVNAPVWTLRYEIVLYGALLLAFATGLLGKRVLMLGLTLGWSIVFVGKLALFGEQSGSAFVDHMLHFGFSFLVGSTAWLYREKIPMSGVLALGGLVALIPLAGTIWIHPAGIIAATYFAFWVGYVPKGPIRAYNRLGDFSYGIYIIHWPVLSTLIVFYPGLTPLTLFTLTAPITLALSACSWYLLEQPALRQIKPVTQWLYRHLPVERILWRFFPLLQPTAR